MSNFCCTFDRYPQGGPFESTFARFSELQLNSQKYTFMQAECIFLSIYLVLQIFCCTFAAPKVETYFKNNKNT